MYKKILIQLIDQTKSLSQSDVNNLKFAHDLLDNVVTHLSSCVPWHERMTYERLKKRQEVKNKHADGRSIKTELFPVKKKSQPKRKSAVKEDMRRQEDGRAASLIIYKVRYKVREEIKVFSPGENKPSTPKVIGNLLKAATK